MVKTNGLYRGIGHINFGMGADIVMGGIYLLMNVTTILMTEQCEAILQQKYLRLE